jgi:hypothetical protein
VEAAAAVALLESLGASGASDGERHALVSHALADLRQRLAGWPLAMGTAAHAAPPPPPPLPSPAQPAQPLLPELPEFGDASRYADCIGVARTWTLPCGASLLLRVRAVSVGDTDTHTYVVDAVTNLAVPGRVVLHWGLAVPFGETAHTPLAQHAPGCATGQLHEANAGGAWALTPLGGERDGGDGDAPPAVRGLTARLRPGAGVAALNFLVQTHRGVLDNGGREVRACAGV